MGLLVLATAQWCWGWGWSAAREVRHAWGVGGQAVHGRRGVGRGTGGRGAGVCGEEESEVGSEEASEEASERASERGCFLSPLRAVGAVSPCQKTWAQVGVWRAQLPHNPLPFGPIQVSKHSIPEVGPRITTPAQHRHCKHADQDQIKKIIIQHGCMGARDGACGGGNGAGKCAGNGQN